MSKSKNQVAFPCLGCGKIRMQVNSSLLPSPMCRSCARRSQPTKTAEERFWPKVDKNGPIMPGMTTACEVWTGGVNENDYGVFNFDGKSMFRKAHRVSWFFHYLVWPEPCACHICDNPRCVRWDHLFEGTMADNSADMVAKGRATKNLHQKAKTHCPHGHPYVGANLYVCANGRRHCVACRNGRLNQAYWADPEPHREAARARMAANRAAKRAGASL